MKNTIQKTPFNNVFYYTWLVDLTFLDTDGKDTYNPVYDYVTNIEANDQNFLQKDVFVFWGTSSTKQLILLMELYVCFQSIVSGNSNIGTYYANWLNHTISISRNTIPELAQWCTQLNVDSFIETFNPPKFISIKMIDTNGAKFTQQLSLNEHFGISKEVPTLQRPNKSNQTSSVPTTKQTKQTSVLDTHLTTDQAAEILSKDKSTLSRWANAKYLIPVKVGRSNYYKKEDIQAILDGKTTINN